VGDTLVTGLALHYMITGALVVAYAVAGLFFLRFWRDTRDRLFACFAIAFLLLGVQRLALGIFSASNEDLTILYIIRLTAFLLILWAIIDKNRAE
jgi:hypothetical protein